MKRIDIIAPLIIGEIVALSGLAILKNLGIEKNILYLVLPIALPILSLLGLWVAFIIGKKFLIFFQASKFVLVGALNTLIDLGVFSFSFFCGYLPHQFLDFLDKNIAVARESFNLSFLSLN